MDQFFTPFFLNSILQLFVRTVLLLWSNLLKTHCCFFKCVCVWGVIVKNSVLSILLDYNSKFMLIKLSELISKTLHIHSLLLFKATPGVTGANPGIPESRAVVCQDDQLGFSLADHLLGLLVAQDIFPTLHHQLETRVDGLHGLFLNRQTQH